MDFRIGRTVVSPSSSASSGLLYPPAAPHSLTPTPIFYYPGLPLMENKCLMVIILVPLSDRNREEKRKKPLSPFKSRPFEPSLCYDVRGIFCKTKRRGRAIACRKVHPSRHLPPLLLLWFLFQRNFLCVCACRGLVNPTSVSPSTDNACCPIFICDLKFSFNNRTNRIL